MAEIVQYTGDVIRSGEGGAVDPTRLGDCPRCGRPVIRGQRGFGCSGWRDGCPFVLWREYRGQSLEEGAIRELLQRRVLLRPLTLGEGGQVVLSLTNSGALSEIPVPKGRPQEPPSSSRRKTAKSRTKPGCRRSAKAANGDGSSPAGEKASER